MNLRNSSLAILIFFLISLAAFTPIQLIKTSLKVTVLNTAGNPEVGTEVQLFSNFDDFESENNPVTEKYLTDDKGTVSFKGLESKSYFIMARKGDFTNIGMGTQSDTLRSSKINKVNIIID